MFDYASLRKANDKAEWFGESADGIELCIRGDDQGPEPGSVELARTVIASLGEVSRKATQMAASFMKDDGDWHLTTLDIGEGAKRQECDFLVGLYFDPKDGSDEYGYTKFEVGFHLQESEPATSRIRPRKLVITYW
ncbi:hypothetical protein [Pseudacidovorax intermedius]|uniref:hypothetical protein n=1 Tax=Pseudacidovorax intermedius TaxID=433924 RepID=UPI0005C2A0CE|nr:hypothetical protein [Pseudacidovorax intermedius]